MGAFTGQCYEQNMVHYLYLDFTFADAGLNVLGQVPRGAVISDAYVAVSTAFNAGTSSVLDIGFQESGSGAADDDNSYADNLDVSTVGRKTNTTIDTSAGLLHTEGAEITATLTLTGTAATAGAARVVVEYTVDNNAP